jgi:hypothetical protein
MQFFTNVPISSSSNRIGYQSKIVSIGSCFAENIGAKLHYYQFKQSTNPFGIIFNPVSIEIIIRRVIQKEYFTEKDIFFNNERWHCFEVHSELSSPDKAFFLKNLNETLDNFLFQISTATHFTLTLGTSWVYKTIVSDKVVANCHKIPQKEFTKQLLSADKIAASLENIVQLITGINPHCHFIITISPVRHLKDGFVENQISKAHLISAVYYFIKRSKNKNLNYFPSYEIMMDELRDYRFYSEDLLHPNSTAIDYIWSKFTETNVEKSSISTMSEVASIRKSLEHRSFNPASISHQKFLKNVNEKIIKLQKLHPFMEF